MPCSSAVIGEVIWTVLPFRRISPRQDVHQRGFTGAILADECMNLALLQAEVHMIQRMGAGELFVDLLHFQQDLF